jgi:hypothetical protein
MNKYSQKIITYITAIALMLSLVVAPTLVSAKENENKEGNNKAQGQSVRVQSQTNVQVKTKDQDDNDKKEEKKETGCFRAFGHLIAPGWIKHNAKFTLSDECLLPFGIGKKFHDNNSTTTPTIDTTAPIITSLTANPRVTSTVIYWTTNERSDSTVYITAPSTSSVTRSGLVRDHQIVVNSLATSTTYHIYNKSSCN